VVSVILFFVGYRLGNRSQKTQSLREYVSGIVKEEYRPLFTEIRWNSQLLDDYLENPNENFDFSELGKIYDEGLEEFMKLHHKDLFEKVDFFRKNIVPKFHEFDTFELMKEASDICADQLNRFLPEEFRGVSKTIANDLFMTINPYYIIPDLLKERYGEVRTKIEDCVQKRTDHIQPQKSTVDIVLGEEPEAIDFDKISQSIITKVKPQVEKLRKKHRELKKLNDEEVKEKLLPLLQKYISNPI